VEGDLGPGIRLEQDGLILDLVAPRDQPCQRGEPLGVGAQLPALRPVQGFQPQRNACQGPPLGIQHPHLQAASGLPGERSGRQTERQTENVRKVS